jgi:hypothetical protein
MISMERPRLFDRLVLELVEAKQSDRDAPLLNCAFSTNLVYEKLPG